jgi:hypothetical protein
MDMFDDAAGVVIDRWDSVTGGRASDFLANNQTFGNIVTNEDRFFAGWSNKLTGGGTNWLREQIYGHTATQDHSGGWYTAGSITGDIHNLLFMFAGGGEGSWAGEVANLWFAGLDAYYGASAMINIFNNDGGSWQDWLQVAFSALGLGGRLNACRVRPVVDAPNRIYRLTSAEMERMAESPTSIDILRQKLGRTGQIDSSEVRLERALPSEVPDLGGRPVYGWVTERAGRPVTDSRGRATVKLTDNALASLEEAVTTVGHELHHLKELRAGAGTSEAAAEAAALEYWRVFQERYRKLQ